MGWATGWGSWALAQAKALAFSGVATACEAGRWEKAQKLLASPVRWEQAQLSQALEAAWANKAPRELSLALLRHGARPRSPQALPGMLGAWCALESPRWALALVGRAAGEVGDAWLRTQATPEAICALVRSRAPGWSSWRPDREEREAIGEIFQRLLRAGALDQAGLSQALAWACGWRLEGGLWRTPSVNASAAQALLDLGASPAGAPLAGAAAAWDGEAMRALSAAGARMDLPGPSGRLPLMEMCAAARGWRELVEETDWFSTGEIDMPCALDAAMEGLPLDGALGAGPDGKTGRELLAESGWGAFVEFFDEALARNGPQMLARQERRDMEQTAPQRASGGPKRRL